MLVLDGANKTHRSKKYSSFMTFVWITVAIAFYFLNWSPRCWILNTESLFSTRNTNNQENNSHVLMWLHGAQGTFSPSRAQDKFTEQHPDYPILQPRCICIVNSHLNWKLEVTPVILALLFNSEGTPVPKVIIANLFQLLLDSAYTELSVGTFAIPGLWSSLRVCP